MWRRRHLLDCYVYINFIRTAWIGSVSTLGLQSARLGRWGAICSWSTPATPRVIRTHLAELEMLRLQVLLNCVIFPVSRLR